ncbi:glycyl-tRNA synthetase subunit alpha [Streptococcus pneumoniae 6901-05]|nr:glycyl-tRNA synthetase subunit alpha [Streptococcus pneumoniae 6901-05]
MWKEIRKRGFKNKAFRTLEDVMNQLQDVIQGLEKEVIKSIVNRRWNRMLLKADEYKIELLIKKLHTLDVYRAMGLYLI